MKIYNKLGDFHAEKRTSVALGYFDGVHLGHAKVIEKAVNQAKKEDLIPVLFTFRVEQGAPYIKKGGEDIISFDEKIRLCKNLGVEAVLSPSFSEIKGLSPKEFMEEILIKTLNVKNIICGADFSFGHRAKGNIKTLAGYFENTDVQIFVVDDFFIGTEEVRSKSIRKYITDGELEHAKNLLGRYYSYNGKVLNGKKLGRVLGFPTINQGFRKDSLHPKTGVYASLVEVEGKFYPGATSIGTRPTTDEKGRINSETYIIDFENADLYDQNIRVIPVYYLRGEEKFESLETLILQMEKDVLNTKKLIRPLIAAGKIKY